MLMALSLGWCVLYRMGGREKAAPAPRAIAVAELKSVDPTETTRDFWSPAWHGLAADPASLNRLRRGRSVERDDEIRSFLAADLPRGRKLGTLLDLLPMLDAAGKSQVLDVMAIFHPIEASARLASMLRETRDSELAVKILRTLRAATLITSLSGRVDFDDPELAKAFELIQRTFGEELSNMDGEAHRFREAMAAISDVFPGEEAVGRFESLEASLAAARREGAGFPLTETELYGRWLEYSMGGVEGRDFRKLNEFLHDHPQAVGDEGIKARVLGLLSVTPLHADEWEAAALLVDGLEPVEAPDDSFVRWLDVKSRFSGPIDGSLLLRSASPMRKAALIHFGNLELRNILDRQTGEALRRGLEAAAANPRESEARDFLLDAAEAIPVE